MNLSVKKKGIEGYCEIVCKDLNHIEILNYDKMFGKGCDVIIINHDKKVVYIIECKCTPLKPRDDEQIINQINECDNYIKNITKNEMRIKKIFLKQRGQRIESWVVKNLRKNNISVKDLPLRIEGS